MLSNEDFKKLKKQIAELLTAKFKELRNDIKISRTENRADFKSLNAKLDKFFAILERLEKRQIILEKKMREIEDYFDPREKN